MARISTLCLGFFVLIQVHTTKQTLEDDCYDELGCFPTDYPWTSVLRPLPAPQTPSVIDTALQCFTRANHSEEYRVDLWPKISLNGCPFDGNKLTVILTHGYMQSGNFSWLQELKDHYLHLVDVNFFIIDWGKGAMELNYLQVASNTRIVGAEGARFVKYLQDNHGISPANLHLIGHSLGAHICSYIAKRIPNIDRLTALDPAQPGFEGTDSRVRLDVTDAKFIDVVHTNAAPFIPFLGYGMIAPRGHVDFYINGGMHQPGCEVPTPLPGPIPEIKDIRDLANITIEEVSALLRCSHIRAYEIYVRVLQENCIVWGRKATLTEGILNAASGGKTERVFKKKHECDPEHCIPLSLDTPKYKARGVFAATTTVHPPYCETDAEINNKLIRESSGTGPQS